MKSLVDPFGWNERAVCLTMSRLTATFSFARRSRWFPLHADRIGRGRLGRVRGVELESRFQVEDSGFAIGDPLLHSTEHCRDRRLGRRAETSSAPKLIRDRKRV